MMEIRKVRPNKDGTMESFPMTEHVDWFQCYGVYERESDGTITQVADFNTRVEAISFVKEKEGEEIY